MVTVEAELGWAVQGAFTRVRGSQMPYRAASGLRTQEHTRQTPEP